MLPGVSRTLALERSRVNEQLGQPVGDMVGQERARVIVHEHARSKSLLVGKVKLQASNKEGVYNLYNILAMKVP